MRTVAALLTLAMPCALCAADFDYTFVDAGLTNSEIEVGAADIDGDGIGLGVSFDVAENINLIGSWSDQDYDFDIDGSRWSFGAGYHTGINDDLDFVADVSYIDVSIDTPLGDADDDGLGLRAGIRGHAGDKLEFDAGIGYLDFEDSDTTLNLGARYYFNDSFALGAGLVDADAGMSWTIGVRAEFGGSGSNVD